MLIYLAGAAGTNRREILWQKTISSRLLSYYNILKKEFAVDYAFKLIKRSNMKMKSKTNKINLFLDSGAFSAFTQNKKINIQDYISFIKKNKNHIDTYAVLDVIGSAKKTWKNQKIMEKAGLHPLPCFHFGEDIKYLKRYIKNYDYIALGGMVPISSKNLKVWLDDLFINHICDKQGIPKVKIHGFGMTSLSLMLRYPFYSVDSTSWVVTGRMGGILIPKTTKGSYDYLKNPHKVTVSAKSPDTKKQGAHFNNCTSGQQKIFKRYLKEKGFKLGKSTFRSENPKTYEPANNERWNKKKEGIIETIVKPGLCNDYKLRDEINIQYFLDLEKNMKKWPWAFKVKKRMKGFFE